jgi:photosystem II stability/assembly factor-like uncharacterized protein
MKSSFILGLSLLLTNIPVNAQENWEKVNIGMTDNFTDIYFLDNQNGWVIGHSGTLIRFTNGIINWYYNIIPFQNLNAIHFVNQNIGWIVGDNGLIIKTTDAGNSWFEQEGGQDYYLNDLHFFDDQIGLICGGRNSLSGGKILRTTNGGNQWNEITFSSIYSPRFWTVYFLDNNLGWTVGTNEIIFRTTDGGVTWDSLAYLGGGGWQNYHFGIYFLDSLNGNICGWTNFGSGFYLGIIHKTSDGGYSWTVVAEVGYGSFNSFAYHAGSNSLYSVGNESERWPYIKSKIFKSLDGGNHWDEVSNPGLERLNKVAFAGPRGWIVGNGTILKSYIEETINPSEFNLMQNYPNPFNPDTKIKYKIPVLSFVTLKVYDVLGNDIATIVSEEKPVGSYEVEFSAIGGSASGGDAYTLTSGIYFYQLRSGNFVETKKMVLLK